MKAKKFHLLLMIFILLLVVFVGMRGYRYFFSQKQYKPYEREGTITGVVTISEGEVFVVKFPGTKSVTWYKVMNRSDEVKELENKIIKVKGKIVQPTDYPYRYNIWIKSDIEILDEQVEYIIK